VAVSEKGWSSHFLGVEWLKHFDRRTRAMGRGEYIMLIIDGHDSHRTMEFYKYCVEAKIILYCLSSHTTHHLQPRRPRRAPKKAKTTIISTPASSLRALQLQTISKNSPTILTWTSCTSRGEGYTATSEVDLSFRSPTRRF
jgi:hypothetical protein